MRRILVEKARRKQRRKHGGELHRIPLDNVEIESAANPLDLLASTTP